MRLLTTAPLQHLSDYGVPEAKLELVRKFLGFNQKLKHNEQKLNYLRRCKNDNVFPVSILNGVRASCVKNTQYTRNLLTKLRKLALNQAIEDSHNCIRECKKTLSGTKHQLYLNISDQF